jgi:hypothetical protein
MNQQMREHEEGYEGGPFRAAGLGDNPSRQERSPDPFECVDRALETDRRQTAVLMAALQAASRWNGTAPSRC